MQPSRVAAWLGAAFLGVTACPAIAKEADAASTRQTIEINVTPFIWAPSFKGAMRQGPLAVPLDISAGDIAGGLKVGFMGYGDVRTPDFLFSGQVVGARFSKDGFEPLFGAKTRAQLASAEALAGPRIRHGQVEIAPLVGLRFNHLKGQLNPGSASEIALSRGWTIGMVGAQVETPVLRDLNLRARISAGVVGPGRFRSRDAIVAIDYRLGKAVSLIAGYRWARERVDPRDPDRDLGLSLEASGPLAAVHFGPF